MLKINLKTIILLMIMFFVLIVPTLGEEQEYIDENPITSEFIKQRMIDRGYSINPNALEDVKNTKDVVATFGVMPDRKSGSESYNWWISICNITDKISEDAALEQYLGRSGGFVGGYGPSADGTIHILFVETLNGQPFRDRDSVTDEEFREIVDIVEKYAEAEGIKSVPIVFLVEEPQPPLVGEYPSPPSNEVSKQSLLQKILAKFTSLSRFFHLYENMVFISGFT